MCVPFFEYHNESYWHKLDSQSGRVKWKWFGADDSSSAQVQSGPGLSKDNTTPVNSPKCGQKLTKLKPIIESEDDASSNNTPVLPAKVKHPAKTMPTRKTFAKQQTPAPDSDAASTKQRGRPSASAYAGPLPVERRYVAKGTFVSVSLWINSTHHSLMLSYSWSSATFAKQLVKLNAFLTYCLPQIVLNVREWRPHHVSSLQLAHINKWFPSLTHLPQWRGFTKNNSGISKPANLLKNSIHISTTTVWKFQHTSSGLSSMRLRIRRQ